MGILMWDKPARVRDKEEHASISFDGGPPGGYVPNMSEEDSARWKAKLVNGKTDHAQVEIRKTFKGAQLLLIVSLGNGYNYKNHKWNATGENWREGSYTKGVNVHMSMNGPAQMSFQDMHDLQTVISEAKGILFVLQGDLP